MSYPLLPAVDARELAHDLVRGTVLRDDALSMGVIDRCSEMHAAQVSHVMAHVASLAGRLVTFLSSASGKPIGDVLGVLRHDDAINLLELALDAVPEVPDGT